MRIGLVSLWSHPHDARVWAICPTEVPFIAKHLHGYGTSMSLRPPHQHGKHQCPSVAADSGSAWPHVILLNELGPLPSRCPGHRYAARSYVSCDLSCDLKKPARGSAALSTALDQLVADAELVGLSSPSSVPTRGQGSLSSGVKECQGLKLLATAANGPPHSHGFHEVELQCSRNLYYTLSIIRTKS